MLFLTNSVVWASVAMHIFDRELEQKDTEIQKYRCNCINTKITTMSYRTKLLACAICGRKFQIARLKDHEDICRRVTLRGGVF